MPPRECGGPHRQASSERISVEQDRHRAAADIDPPDETEQAGCRGTIIIITITITTGTQPVGASAVKCWRPPRNLFAC